MIVINKLTKPGGIRRIDILPGTVRVVTYDGQDKIYKLVSTSDDNLIQEK